MNYGEAVKLMFALMLTFSAGFLAMVFTSRAFDRYASGGEFLIWVISVIAFIASGAWLITLMA